MPPQVVTRLIVAVLEEFEAFARRARQLRADESRGGAVRGQAIARPCLFPFGQELRVSSAMGHRRDWFGQGYRRLDRPGLMPLELAPLLAEPLEVARRGHDRPDRQKIKDDVAPRIHVLATRDS